MEESLSGCRCLGESLDASLKNMINFMAMKSRKTISSAAVGVSDAEASDWYARYEAAIADYERRTEKRRERKLLRLAQARRDDALRAEYEDTREWIRTHPCPEILPDTFAFHYRRLTTVTRALLSLSIFMGNVIGIGFALRFARNGVTKCINKIECRLRRHVNYEIKANPRRRSAAEAERRKIRRRTTKNPEPRANDVRRAWLDANESCESIIAFGALIHDLECYVDNGLNVTDDGVIVGRRAGVCGWLKEHVPELSKRYKTIMRYKAIAKRCRQFLGLHDPSVLDPRDPRLVRLLKGCPATQKDIRVRLDAAISRQEQEAETRKAQDQSRRTPRRNLR